MHENVITCTMRWRLNGENAGKMNTVPRYTKRIQTDAANDTLVLRLFLIGKNYFHIHERSGGGTWEEKDIY